MKNNIWVCNAIQTIICRQLDKKECCLVLFICWSVKTNLLYISIQVILDMYTFL